MRIINQNDISRFRQYLINHEKALATLTKYTYDINKFAEWLKGSDIEKSQVLSYKQYLQTIYAPSSVNSILSSLNSFFEAMGWHDLHVKTLKIQRQTFTSPDKELTKQEYERLLKTALANGQTRLYWLMQTICSTGIRVSELPFITVEAIKNGCANINCKGKLRRVYLPDALCRVLKVYCRARNIKNGSVFVTQSGKPIDRSNIWSSMKALCHAAGVSERKVFPHNLRHLFARTHYSMYKDIVRLADILGHVSINTTRIYTMESGEEHRRQVQKLGLVIQRDIQRDIT